ncbi:hypothetical protein H6G00_22405 [Leptolyngbya sp. FACHB-541]|uniref:hypothetical protein n=1 Tax=Leptolyngbya sp. FACHB-541 TaxID=2692810 RepID=UPI0016844048|nr:hypothetical protein [Leptolyngbya sp. FACHB-541]MBD1999330.1 hypothetical protein [Leptolyngbya sp. FACHB-541]
MLTNYSPVKLLVALTASATCMASTIVLFVSPARADGVGTFAFNRPVGSVQIGSVTVEQGTIEITTPASNSSDEFQVYTPARTWRGDGATVSASLRIPTCPNQYHTEGYVTVRYTNDQASITRTYQIDRHNEGQAVNPQWQVQGYYGEPNEGHVNVSASVDCVYHGVNGNGGPSWAPWNW